MSYIEGHSRDQTTLFPEVIDNYISEDNPVRFIDAFVDNLNLKELGFKNAIENVTGRPPYHPADMLKLFIYGYINRIRTGRTLEKATHCNLEIIWLI